MALSTYLTLQGKRQLQAEFDELWHRRRPEVVKALKAAAAEGDRSENAEYIYRKKELREIDRRVRYLGKRIGDAVVVNEKPADSSRVFFGARVTAIDAEGDRHHWHIVGRDEANAAEQKISLDSPVAQGLLKHQVGDEVLIRLPSGQQAYEIETIDYPAEQYQ